MELVKSAGLDVGWLSCFDLLVTWMLSLSFEKFMGLFILDLGSLFLGGESSQYFKS